MTDRQKNDLLKDIKAMPTKTAPQKIRQANALRHFANIENDDGAAGRIRDILAKSNGSRMYNFSKQGQADCFVWVDGRRYKAERKTNGGRIGELYGKNAPKFVVYSMDVCNSGTGQMRRVVKAVVMPTAQFLTILEDCHAVKNTNGKHPEVAIQVTSKALFLALSDYPVSYDPARRYTKEELHWEDGEA